MSKPAKAKPFVDGLSVASLFSPETPETPKIPETKTLSKFLKWDYETEILDVQEGWIYSKTKSNKKGKKLRKFYEYLHSYSSRGGDGITFWKPKIEDLAYCEAKRWMAVQHYREQYAKIKGAFEEVTKNAPFCCIRNTNESPGFAWVVFNESVGVSWDWWEGSYQKREKGNPERPDCQLRQDIGDRWFEYEKRCRQLQTRLGHFENLFMLALEKRYQDEFYRMNQWNCVKRKLIINGREYIIGLVDGRRFGVIVQPEDVAVEIVAPGPVLKKNKKAKK